MKVLDERKLTSIPNQKHLQSALKKLEMGECKGSVSPKLDRACIDGDSERLDEGQTSRFRSSVLTLLYLSNERTDIQSTVRLLCTKLKSPTALEMRQLKRLLRYVKGTEDMSTVFEMRDSNDRREQLVKRLEVYTDSDWASDQVTRKSTSGAVIMVEGMRLHAQSRDQASVALSSCEAEVMAASEGIKEALLLQEVLMFAGLGHCEIEVKMDTSAAHAFFHRRGVGRTKHRDSRILWLQDLIAAGGVRLTKIPRTQNLADMLTHTPGAKELEVFLRLMSLNQQQSQPTTTNNQPTTNQQRTNNEPTTNQQRTNNEQSTTANNSQPASQPASQPTNQPTNQPTGRPNPLAQPPAQQPAQEPANQPTSPTSQTTKQPNNQEHQEQQRHTLQTTQHTQHTTTQKKRVHSPLH